MPLQPSWLPTESSQQAAVSSHCLSSSNASTDVDDDDVRNIRIKHDILSGKPSSLTEAHSSVTDKCHQPARFVISCLAALLDGSQFVCGDRLPCRCIASVRHECTTEGIASFNAMLTHCQIDDGTHRGKDTFDCVDVHALLKAPVSELRSL